MPSPSRPTSVPRLREDARLAQRLADESAARLAGAAAVEADVDRRASLLRALQDEVQRRGPYIFLFQHVEQAAHRAGVDGLVIGASPSRLAMRGSPSDESAKGSVDGSGIGVVFEAQASVGKPIDVGETRTASGASSRSPAVRSRDEARRHRVEAAPTGSISIPTA